MKSDRNGTLNSSEATLFSSSRSFLNKRREPSLLPCIGVQQHAELSSPLHVNSKNSQATQFVNAARCNRVMRISPR